LSGTVFGTSWHLTYLPKPDGPSPEDVQAVLSEAFDVVNQSMNHYDPNALISRFNALAPNTPLEVDWDFALVLTEALRVNERTNGAYDVTVSPLANLWGFGPEGPKAIPTPEQISEAQARVGVDKLVWDSSTRTLAKTHAGVALDFSSIAKGYGVDLGADALRELGLTDFMFDIGGELQLAGSSPRGDAWRIAIEAPREGSGSIEAALSLTDTGVATSGDYRNYFEHEGERYSHLIDPRTGWPIKEDVVSVTVIAGSTAIADAWATALMVLGSEAGLAAAEQYHIAAYVISLGDGRKQVAYSEAFAPYLQASSLESQ
jgi:thiamine biosynthesis lipoprotein